MKQQGPLAAAVSCIPAEVHEALRAMGLASEQSPSACVLGGGVSCDTWRVDLNGRSICVKRALPGLRVEQEWLAPVERNAYEVAWLETVAGLVPGAVPAVLGHDALAGVFAMEYLPPDTHPLWKDRLRAGPVETGSAVDVARTLAQAAALSAAVGTRSRAHRSVVVP